MSAPLDLPANGRPKAQSVQSTIREKFTNNLQHDRSLFRRFLISCPRLAFAPQSLVRFRRKPPGHNLLKRRVIHKLGKYLLILVHPFDKKRFKQIFEYQLKLFTRVYGCRLLQAFVSDRRLDYLVKEKLIGLVKLRPKSLVDDVDEPRQRHRLLVDNTRAHFRWSI